ncbi:MAG TPA: hypothetical protein VKW06_22675 [Candidatus Angelobacter sp.]|nr:hypothetical protein [Candidatus Angelobacter sp.]
MNHTQSNNEKTILGIAGAMRPLWKIGIPATAVLSALVAIGFAIALDGCSSNKDRKTNVSSSNVSSLISSNSNPGNLTSALPGNNLSEKKETPKKKTVVRPSTVGFSDSVYGVSFRYPRSYTMMTPDRAKLTESVERVPLNFIQPGGVTLATIALPDGNVTSLFKVSVNKDLSAQQCEQFQEPDGSDIAGNSPVDPDDSSIPAKISLRGSDYTRVETGTEQTDIRYYHHFDNGACYEFAMAVEESSDNTRAVDHFRLFDKLERIMASVKIKVEPVPAVTASVPEPTPEK